MADEDIQLTGIEIEVMHHICNAATLGQTTAKESHQSKRLVEFGYIAKDGSGHLALTPKGETFLKSRAKKVQ
jgi:Mn-dependent DtxR family transcriptional regulator